MEFGFTPEEENFRQEVREFINKEFPPEFRWRFGVAHSPWVQSHDGERWEYVKAMRRKFGARGYHSLSWPKEYGGQNSLILRTIADEEMMYSNCPGLDHIGVTFFAPTLIRFGNEAQKRKYLPGIAKGETYWCELLSEPDSGSDLASLKTQAVEDGNDYIINGQKTWTTGAHHTQMGFILVRTDASLVKHKGLSYFIIDMNTPGITIRPIYDMLGEHELNEVFFDDVRVPKENMVYEKNQGWQVTLKTLDYERFSYGYYASVKGYLNQLIPYIEQCNDRIRPVIKQQLVHLLSECEMAKMLHYRAMWLMSQGVSCTYEVAIIKMYNCELTQRASELGMQIFGPFGILRCDSEYAPLCGWPACYYFNAAYSTIAAGTSEIDRNVIAIKGLGLPAV